MKDKPSSGKLLLFLAGVMVLCGVVGWLSLNDQLHADGEKAWVFEKLAGTSAYNHWYLFVAAFLFLVSLLAFGLIAFSGISDSVAAMRKKARKQERRANWEAKQAQEANKGTSNGAS